MKNQELKNLESKAITVEEKLSRIYTDQPSEGMFWSVAIEDETIQRHSDKILEAEKELLVYSYFNPVSHEKYQKGIQGFIRSIQTLVHAGVTIKLLLGGQDVTQLQQDYLQKFIFLKDFLTMLATIEIKFTPIITNTFDIIDREKVLLKIPNPVQPDEYFALIYVWQHQFARQLRTKFLEMWEKAEEFSIPTS